MHKVVHLAALSVLIDGYVNRKSEEKLDFLEKMAAWLTRHVTVFSQQSNAKSIERKKLVDEEEEKKDDDVPEVPRQPMTTHQNQTVTKLAQGSDRQHNVSALMQPQNRQPVATKHGVHQIRDISTATAVPTRQALISQTDCQVQEEMSRMQAAEQDQDVLAQAMLQGNIPMVADPSPSELMSEDVLGSSMNLLDSMVSKLNSIVQ